MLVVSRKSSESIHIGKRIIVTVLGIFGNKVRLGIDAPREVVVLRAELLGERINPPDVSSMPVVDTESTRNNEHSG